MDSWCQLPFAEGAYENPFSNGFSRSKIAHDGLHGFFSVRFATANAKALARYFQLAFGFQEVAHRGLETRSLCLASHVVKCGAVVFEFMDTLCPTDRYQAAASELTRLDFLEPELAARALQVPSLRAYLTKSVHETVPETLHESGLESAALEEAAHEAVTASLVSAFVARHGMGIFDIVLEVADVDAVFARAVANGAGVVRRPTVSRDGHGEVVTAAVCVAGSDLVHTLVLRRSYTGPYLPHYGTSTLAMVPSKGVKLVEIDHCVQNFSWNEMMPTARFYAAAFGLQKFWSVDDTDVWTGNTGLRSIVMSSATGGIKIPINEPAEAPMKGQIEEFYEYFNGPGVQHVAVRTTDIIGAVTTLRARGIEFNSISDSYYANLASRLEAHDITLREDFGMLVKNHILVDFDPATRFRRRDGSYCCHYILQIFTTPFHDRPTFFMELIQRYHHDGFGKGTFKGLFELIELQQKVRGTLVPV